MYKIEPSDAVFTYGSKVEHPNYDRKTRHIKPPPHIERRVIAWDMEGISLSGQDRPQHPVLFGCSAEPDRVLVGERVPTRSMLQYIIQVGEKYPHSIHVGYAFKYDANMIIAGLPERVIIRLWKNGTASWRFKGDPALWRITWIPGKKFTVTRQLGRGTKRISHTKQKTTVTIYDYSSFFGGKTFLASAEDILRDDLSATDKDTIAHGKAVRGHQSWDDMVEIRHYWRREIELIQRVFEKFRDVMYRAGFPLKEWYGPGALANFINASRKIRPHLGAVQTTSGAMPAAVHEASKRAFSGGHIELYRAGRITGPIYVVDINQAYPFALTQIPSLSPEEGFWKHVEYPTRTTRFGFYRVRFHAPNAVPIEYRRMPLFYRDRRGLISYPNMVHGWYASPEAEIARRVGAEITEGWEWISNESIFPWSFLGEMYDTRKRLGKDNLLSMPFKLGPNSLYGKYAQTIGWDKKKKLPPKSHALPVAAWITSYCRAMLYSVIMQSPNEVIACETDAIYTTRDPRDLKLSIGDDLGEWSYDQYEEMLYLQSGMYHYRKDGEWKGVKSRGILAAEYPYEATSGYLQSLRANEPWDALTLQTKPRFIGAGAAIASSEPLRDIMASWRPMTKEMTLGETGKRRHFHKVCPECIAGIDPWETPHSLAISSTSDGDTLSAPRRLPWEREHTAEVQEIRDRERLEGELIAGA